MPTLVIVESPKKVATLQEYLGSGYKVAASGGHIRDLPEKPTEGIGLRMPNYVPQYEILSRSAKTVSWLKKLIGQCDRVLLATDPDREGEAIAWHLAQVLKIARPQRIAFNEITRSAVAAAVQAPKPIDMHLVAAQEARRSVDRLVGYQVSRPLGDAIGRRGVSAGRVQSPALALIVERERAIRDFVSRTHYDAVLHFEGPQGSWRAVWQFDDPLQGASEKLWLDLSLAQKAAVTRAVTVLSCEERIEGEAPPAPFTTSTLQQAASVALDFNPETTMRLAQSLKDKGCITYHRTDNPNLSVEAIETIRALAASRRLPLPPSPRHWKAKKNAQEAHEAIRPTDFGATVAGDTAEEQALYQLIYVRALACQLTDAQYAVRDVRLASRDHGSGTPFEFLATGRTLAQKGWRQMLSAAVELEDEGSELTPNPVPPLPPGTHGQASRGECRTHRTQPPKRFTEASLIRALEDAGVGRPSTYAAIMTGLKHHLYVTVERKRLIPTELGSQIYDALRPRFSFLRLDYTCALELELDAIAQGNGRYVDLVRKIDADLQKELKGMPRVAPNLPAAPAPTVDGPRPSRQSSPRRGGAADGLLCPDCGKSMVRRERKADKAHFWGCTGYPSCKKTFADKDGKPVTGR